MAASSETKIKKKESPYFRPISVCKEIIDKDFNKIPIEHRIFNEADKSNPNINPWKKMIVGILSCSKYKYRYENFMKLYGELFEQVGLDYYVIYADPDIETNEDEDYVIENKFFTAKVKESYETLAHKLAVFYSYINNNTDYEYIIKIDDACLFLMSAALKRLDKPYVGAKLKPTINKIHFGKCSDKQYNSQPLDFGHNLREFNPNIDDKLYEELYHINLAGGGYGYRLRRDAFQYVDKYKEHILSLGLSYEDVLFGQIFYLEGIEALYLCLGKYHCIGKK